MAYRGDGPSYDASRVLPRNLTGFAPGKWIDSPSTAYKPAHGGYPDYKGIENLSAAADEGRAVYPNEDLSGRVHPEGTYMDAYYFDGVKLASALRIVAHEAQRRLWQMETALRNYRLAENSAERAVVLPMLVRTYHNLNNPTLKAISEVEETIATIDHQA